MSRCRQCRRPVLGCYSSVRTWRDKSFVITVYDDVCVCVCNVLRVPWAETRVSPVYSRDDGSPTNCVFFFTREYVILFYERRVYYYRRDLLNPGWYFTKGVFAKKKLAFDRIIGPNAGESLTLSLIFNVRRLERDKRRSHYSAKSLYTYSKISTLCNITIYYNNSTPPELCTKYNVNNLFLLRTKWFFVKRFYIWYTFCSV